MVPKFQLLVIVLFLVAACKGPQSKDGDVTHDNTKPIELKQGSFGFDHHFLSKFDSLIILQNNNGQSRVIVSAKYQGKVFTSTAEGEAGKSFGWINYKAFTDSVNLHMNAYGGENRLWLGPEGGPFSLFFPKGATMTFDNWKTPKVIDTESWSVVAADSSMVVLKKDASLVNYAGTSLKVSINRIIRILDNQEIERLVGGPFDKPIRSVGYETSNELINRNQFAWDENTGMPCIWMLDMFSPSPQTTIVIPFRSHTTSEKAVTTNYFGEIPPDRIKVKDDVIFFKADGKHRGKLGVRAKAAKSFAGSYDAISHVLTVAIFEVDSSRKYLNQEWTIEKPPFVGDAVNAYNDGILENKTQLGPFYEIESVSPAAFLPSGKSLTHGHTVLHFTGEKQALSGIAQKVFGVSIDEIEHALK